MWLNGRESRDGYPMRSGAAAGPARASKRGGRTNRRSNDALTPGCPVRRPGAPGDPPLGAGCHVPNQGAFAGFSGPYGRPVRTPRASTGAGTKVPVPGGTRRRWMKSTSAASPRAGAWRSGCGLVGRVEGFRLLAHRCGRQAGAIRQVVGGFEFSPDLVAPAGVSQLWPPAHSPVRDRTI